MFKTASRMKLRFATRVGILGTEELWDLPLTSAKNVSLDSIAKSIHKEIKSEAEVSFVTAVVDIQTSLNELRLDIVKEVIAYKIAKNAEVTNAKDKADKKVRLLAILANKQDADLMDMSAADIEKEIAKL